MFYNSSTFCKKEGQFRVCNNLSLIHRYRNGYSLCILYDFLILAQREPYD